MDTYSTLTPKGLLYIPLENRKKAGFKSKDRIQINVQDGKIILQRVPSLEEMQGFLKTEKRYSAEEEEKVLEQEMTKYYQTKFEPGK